MKKKCPFCNTEATYPHNLVKHLAGNPPGHRIPIEKATIIAHSVFNGTYQPDSKPKVESLPPSLLPVKHQHGPVVETIIRRQKSSSRFDSFRTNPENGVEAFLEELLITLVQNKELPKYQFERRVDAIFYLFLPDLLTAYFGSPVETLVPEFPLKKDHNWQSTNVDALLYMRDGESDRIKYWMFLELKTDDGSVRDEQIDVYEKTMRRTMPSLIEDVKGILDRTSASAKYNRLIEQLSHIPSHDQTPIRFIYLAPTIPFRLGHAKHLEEPVIYPLTFAQIEHLPVKRFPEAWEMFRRIAIPVLKRRY